MNKMSKTLLILLGLISLVTAFQINQELSENQAADCPLYFEQMQAELESGMAKWNFEGPMARAQFKKILRTCKSETKTCEERIVSAVLLRIEYGFSLEMNFDREFYHNLYQSTIKTCYEIFSSHLYLDERECTQILQRYVDDFSNNRPPQFTENLQKQQFILTHRQCAIYSDTSCQFRAAQATLDHIANALQNGNYNGTQAISFYRTEIQKCGSYVLQVLKADLMIDESKCQEIFELIHLSNDLENFIKSLYMLSKEEKSKCVQVYETPKSCEDFTAILLLKELQQPDLDIQRVTQMVKDHYETCSKSIFSGPLKSTPEPLASQNCQKFELWIADETIKSEENFDCDAQADTCAKLFAYNQVKATLQQKAEDASRMKKEYARLCVRRKDLLSYLNFGVQSCEKLISNGTIYVSLPNLNLQSFASCAPELRFINTHTEQLKDSSTLGLDVELLQEHQEYRCNIKDESYLNKITTLPAPQFQLNSLFNKNCFCMVTSDSRVGSVTGLRFTLQKSPIKNFDNSIYNDIFYGLRFQGCQVEVIRSPLLARQGEDFVIEVQVKGSSQLLQYALSLIALIVILL